MHEPINRVGFAFGAPARFVAIVCLSVLATGTAIAQHTGRPLTTTTALTSAYPDGQIHPTTIEQVPGIISVPDKVVSSTPIVVLYHGFGPPASPEALAKAVPPIPGAISFYPWLPHFGPRTDASGTNDLVQRQTNDYIGRLLFPVMTQAAAELPRIIGKLSASYHLLNQRPIVLFGFSAGGAAALLSLTESGVRPQGVVVVNSPLSVSQAVDAYERQLGHRYSWTKVARVAAIRYDVGAHALQIARRQPGTAILLMQADHDAGYSPDQAIWVAERLKAAASRFTSEPDIGVSIISDSDHYVLDSSQLKDDPRGKVAAAAARALIADWITRHTTLLIGVARRNVDKSRK